MFFPTVNSYWGGLRLGIALRELWRSSVSKLARADFQISTVI